MKEYLFRYGELNAFCNLCKEQFLFDFYNDKEKNGEVRKQLAVGSALTEEGEELKRWFCNADNTLKLVGTAKDDFNLLFFIEREGKYAAVSPSAKGDVYAVKTQLTYDEASKIYKAVFNLTPVSVYSVEPIVLNFAERFLLTLLCECEVRLGRDKVRFSDVFSEKTFSVLAYAKDFTVKSSEWQQYKCMFSKKCLWKQALVSLCEKGYVFARGKVNPRVCVSEQIYACVSGEQTLFEALYSTGVSVRFYKATKKAGLIEIKTLNSTVTYEQSVAPELIRSANT